MAELPILPLKPERLLADTAHMSAEQMGAYCRLLFTMWLRGGRLLDNEVELARVSGVSLRLWRSLTEVVLRPMTRADGQISQKRLTSTWLEVQELRAKRKVASALGVAARQRNHMVDHMVTNPKPNKRNLTYLDIAARARSKGTFNEED